MTPEQREALEEQAERLRSAVTALMSLSRPTQDRLDRALSLFARTFKYEPTGAALEPYRRIYQAIGDPPVGTMLAVPVETLGAEDTEGLVSALLELYDVVARELAQMLAASEPA
ncbi:MAG: hypothetical protein U0807_15430 [Candidatus Binatia bacterium]